MAVDWPEVSIAALCDGGLATLQTGPFGSQLHAHEYRPIGTPIIPTEAIGRRRVARTALPRVDRHVVDRLARHRLRAGDILFARRGAQATGLSAIIEKDLEGALCGTGAILLRLRDWDEVDPTYLSFALSAPSAVQWLKDHAVGAVMPNLNSDVIRRLLIPLPSVKEQRAIAQVLGALDDKIEVNRRMNETLEAMARALFKSCFVDFDPRRAKMEGGLAHEIGDVDASVEELMSEGVLQVGDGYRAKNDELSSEGLPFARAGNVNDGFSFEAADILGPEGVRKAGDKVSRPLDVVFTSKGTVGRFGFVSPTTPPFVYSPQICFWRSKDHERLNPFVLYQWMQSRAFLDQIDRVKGQTDMAEYVSLRDQRRMRIVVRGSVGQRAGGDHLGAIRARVWNNVDANRTVRALRDALLPKLLSGELRVPEAERVVGKAV